MTEAAACLLATSAGSDGLEAYFAELSRLVAEAWSRAESGEVMPALSSLAALPAVHLRIVEQCGALLEGPAEGAFDDSDLLPGFYL